MINQFVYRASIAYSALLARTSLLQGLEEVPDMFFGSFPSHDSVVPVLLRPIDVLNSIESTLKKALNCYNCSAYLISNLLVPSASPDFVMFLPKFTQKSRPSTSEECDEAPITMGLMGRVMYSKTALMIDNTEASTALNPTVDLDPMDSQLVIAPILDYHGRTLGCIQVVFDLNRSKAFIKGSGNASRENFIEPKRLVESCAMRLFQPLEYALRFINTQFIPPGSNNT